MKYLQFIGTQRSGSNLLRVMLNQLPDISAPHPPHILKTFVPLMPRYGDLSSTENLTLLAADVCRWVNVNPVSWSPYCAVPDNVLSMMKTDGLVGIFEALSEGKALSDGASAWCCKSMESVAYTSLIEEAGLRPIYLYLYRDGRDVALSFMKAVVGPKHIYNLALKWAEEQRLAIQLKERVDPKRFVGICYEDLIADPETQLRRLCAGISVDFTPSMLDYSGSDESRRTAQAGRMWENLDKPVLKDNSRKFIGELSTQQIRIFEQVAGDVLERLGYECVTDAVHGTGFSDDEKEIFMEEEKSLQHHARVAADPGDMERRRPQEMLLKEILSRNPIMT